MKTALAVGLLAFLVVGGARGNTIEYTITDLGPTSSPCSINAAGQVAFGGTLYSDGTATSLGPNTTAEGINAAGQVAGYVYTAPSAYQAFLYSGGTTTGLGTLGGANSIAHGVNAAGQVVGQADTGSGATDAFLHQRDHAGPRALGRSFARPTELTTAGRS